MKDNKFRDGLDRIVSSKDMAVYLLIGCAALFVSALWYGIVGIGGWIPGGVIFVLYTGVISVFTYYRIKRDNPLPDFTLSAELNSTLGSWMSDMEYPVFICSDDGCLVWSNPYGERWFTSCGKAQGDVITDIVPINDADKRITVFDSVYICRANRIKVEDRHYIFVHFENMDALRASEKTYENDRMAIGFISIDNLQDAVQYSTESVNDTLLDVDTKLHRWALKNSFVLMSYDTAKYILLLDTKQLAACIEDKFSILDEIRNTRVGEGISITVSMGIARVGGSLADRERAAQSAHEMALQRGGDQVVCKNGNSVEFFGGRTKAVYKRTNVKARVFSTQLCAEIARSTNVVIMGHRWGDHDSVGSAVGMAKFVRMCGVKFNIVYSKEDKNTAPNIAYARQMEEYKDAFVTGARASELLGSRSLLIVVDVSNFVHLEVPELASRASSIVIVDHHIQPSELPANVKLAYIEPSASSTSELVTEFLEYGLNVKALNKVEAELMFSGIVLDTKQFSKNTGPRTFAAAQYLRGQGAGSPDAIDLYRSELDDLTKEGRMFSNVSIVRQSIAMTYLDKNTDDTYRVIAAKVADKLLTAKHIEASFALVKIGEDVSVSARSGGNINVQLILEQCGGGGHFDMAGAQFKNATIKEAMRTVKNAIDRYMDELEQSRKENK